MNVLNSRYRRHLIGLSVGCFVVFLDQVMKFYIERYYHALVSCNPGIALSIAVYGYVQWFLIGALLTVVVIFLHNATRSGTILQICGYGSILGGGVSNFMDRLTRECVTDYLPFFGLFRFNIADIAITIGVLAVFAVLIPKRE